MANRQDWTYAFLLRLGYPLVENNEIAILTWIRSEWGGAAPIPASFNPLNCVTPLHHSTVFNSIGVQKYETWEDGMDATVQTILESGNNYEPIRTILAGGAKDLVAFLAAVGASHWGSHPTVSYLTYTETHLESERALVVGITSFSSQEDTMILCPTKPNLSNGRQPYAWLDIPNKRVLLYNGASLAGDVPSGSMRIWTIPSTGAVQAMTTTRDNTTHLPDKRGIVIGAFDGGTFQALWS